MRSSLKNASAEARRAETGRVAAKQGRPLSPERTAVHKLCPATGTICLVERKTGECIGEGGACAIQADAQKQAGAAQPIPSLAHSPEQVLANKVNVIPPEVFWNVNALLAERYNGIEARLPHDEVVLRIKGAISDLPFHHHWLSFETVYRDRGWDVVYCLPRDDHDGYWLFTPASSEKNA